MKWQDLLLWKLAIFKGGNGIVKSAIATFLAGTAATAWGEMSHAAKVQLVAGIILAVCIFIEGFVDQTAAKVAQGKPPIGTNGTGNTGHWEKTEVKQTEITNETKSP